MIICTKKIKILIIFGSIPLETVKIHRLFSPNKSSEGVGGIPLGIPHHDNNNNTMFRDDGRALDSDHGELLGVCGEHEVRLHHQVRGPRQGGELPGQEVGPREADQAEVGEQTESRQRHHQSGQSEINGLLALITRIGDFLMEFPFLQLYSSYSH